MANERFRLAIVVSHPIQHFVPFYRELATRPDIELRVFFCSSIGLEAYDDPDMGVVVKWAADMTSGYPHEFLPEARGVGRTGFAMDNPSVGAALTRFAPRVVMLYGYAQKTMLRVLWWRRRRGTPALMVSDGGLGKRRSWLKQMARRIALWPLLRQYSGFLTVGDQNEEMLRRLGVASRRMFRCPFTIDEPLYRAAREKRVEHRAEIRRQFGLSADDFVVLTVGKLAARKRPLDVVEAALRVNAARPEARVVILMCGDGAERPAIEARLASASGPARIAGFVNVDRLPSIYAAADALAHTAEFDHHPLVFSEAACIGLPLIVSDRIGAIGPTDIARPGENALIYPCADIAALADAMARLASDRDLYAAMSEASLRVYEENAMAVSVQGLVAALHAVAPRAGEIDDSRRLSSANTG